MGEGDDGGACEVVADMLGDDGVPQKEEPLGYYLSCNSPEASLDSRIEPWADSWIAALVDPFLGSWADPLVGFWVD